MKYGADVEYIARYNADIEKKVVNKLLRRK